MSIRRCALSARQSIRVCAAYYIRADGSRHIVEFPEPAIAHFRVLPHTLILTSADGTVEEIHPADPVEEWLRLAQSDELVGRLFRFLSVGARDWRALRPILEIIAEDVGGWDAIASRGWATKRSIRLFKHTGERYDTVGLDARHGVSKGKPPAKPMSISHARSLLDSIIHAWLRFKTNRDS